MNHKKAREFQKNIYFCFIDYAKSFRCMGRHKLWKILKEMGIADHFTCLMGNLYGGQGSMVRTRHGTPDWFQIGKGVHQDVYCHLAYLTYMKNISCEMPGIDEAQAGIKITGRNINNLRYADDTILKPESEEELKRLLMKVKEES